MAFCWTALAAVSGAWILLIFAIGSAGIAAWAFREFRRERRWIRHYEAAQRAILLLGQASRTRNETLFECADEQYLAARRGMEQEVK
jgi:cbb3-type cytochrome oxidase subunit 3